MSIKYDDSNRQAVPRCLSYATACSLQVLRTNRRVEEMRGTVVEDSDAGREWVENRNLISAIDLVAEAIIVKDFNSREARKAAKYILRKSAVCSPLVRELAGHFLKRVSTWEEMGEILDRGGYRKEIARLKSSVRDYPLNPIAWCDLSLNYATIGEEDKAKDAMSVAMALGKHNRFILRSAARCYMHFGEADKAVSMLDKSGLCEIDPWITSAEIAIAEATGLKSKCMGKGRDLAGNENLTPFSRSELAASLGTVEMKSGSVRKGKKIMRQAIVQPTENALAQVEWAACNFRIGFDDTLKLSKTVAAPFEAIAKHRYYGKEWKDSLEACKKWGRFQSLSSRPIILSTFIASCLLDNDSEAIMIFEDAVPAQKEDPTAVNNYAFALARVGRTRVAEETLDKCNLDEASLEDKLAISATRGLICFREGKNIEEGRRLYDEAVTGFERSENHFAVAIAKYYWAFEEKRIESEEAETRIREAKRAIEQHDVFELEDLGKKL